jgi:hypothetical protein
MGRLLTRWGHTPADGFGLTQDFVEMHSPSLYLVDWG